MDSKSVELRRSFVSISWGLYISYKYGLYAVEPMSVELNSFFVQFLGSSIIAVSEICMEWSQKNV